MRVILRNPRYAGYASYCDCPERNDHNVTGAEHWKQRLLEDDEGNYIRGEWTPLIDEDTGLEGDARHGGVRKAASVKVVTVKVTVR